MRNDPGLQCRWAIRTDETGTFNLRLPQEIFDPIRRRIASHNADRNRYSVQPPDIRRHVTRPAQPIRFIEHLDHRHRRFRRNPRDFSPDEFIQHNVPDDEDGLAGKRIQDLFNACAIHVGLAR
jgi:hypothetical protein